MCIYMYIYVPTEFGRPSNITLSNGFMFVRFLTNDHNDPDSLGVIAALFVLTPAALLLTKWTWNDG